MTRDELRAALLGRGWELVEIITFREWLKGDPELLAAHRADLDRTYRVEAIRGPAYAAIPITDELLRAAGFDVAGWLDDKLRLAWMDAMWNHYAAASTVS